MQNILSPIIKTELVQTPKGAACKYAWGSHRVNARLYVGGESVIVRHSGRILSWKSGNFSSQGNRIYDSFVAEFDGVELEPREAVKIIPVGNPGSRRVLNKLREEIYNLD